MRIDRKDWGKKSLSHGYGIWNWLQSIFGGSSRKIFEIKGRNKTNPFPILASNLQDIEKIALLGKIGKQLAKIFWPGALTIISTLIDTRISTKVSG